MSMRLFSLVFISLSLLSPSVFAADTVTTTSTDTTMAPPATDTTVAPAPADTTTPAATTTTTTTTTTAAPQAVNDETVKSEIEKLNKTLPNMIDSITELNKVSLEGKNIVYTLKVISMNASELDSKKFSDAISPGLVKGVCGDKDIKALLDNGYTLVYRYNGKDNNLITEVPVKLSDCTATVSQ